MPALVKKTRFKYIAHIMLPDETIREVMGTMEEWNEALVYTALHEMAQKDDGWLLNETIVPEDDPKAVVEGEFTEVKRETGGALVRRDAARPAVSSGAPNTNAGAVLGDIRYFGTFHRTYKGASLCTYKETG